MTDNVERIHFDIEIFLELTIGSTWIDTQGDMRKALLTLRSIKSGKEISGI